MARKPKGFFTNKSNEELLDYTRKHHSGKTRAELQKSEGGLYNTLYRRGLFKSILKEGTIKRLKTPKGFYSDQSDEELLDYAKKHHSGKSKTELQKSEKGLYTMLYRRGLLEPLVEKGTLEIRIKPRGSYSDQSDEELLDYAKKHHSGKSKTELQKSENSLYNTLYRRGLLESLVEKGTLEPKYNPHGFYSDQSDEELLDYTRKHHSKKTIAELQKSEGGLYNRLYRRSLLESLIKEGTLINLRNQYLDSKKFIQFLQEDETAKNLAATAVSMGNQGYDVEKIIEELYSDKFKDLNQLHELLEENRREIQALLEEGTTNLGYYIGEYEIGDRRIVPILLGQAITIMPEEHITPTLEERLVRLLRNEYSPRFNEDQEGTMQEIKERVDSSTGKKQGVYQKLLDHYQEVQRLGEELR